MQLGAWDLLPEELQAKIQKAAMQGSGDISSQTETGPATVQSLRNVNRHFRASFDRVGIFCWGETGFRLGWDAMSNSEGGQGPRGIEDVYLVATSCLSLARQALLQRAAAAQDAQRLVANFREQLEAGRAELEVARKRTVGCKAEVLERAPELLGAATSLAGSRKRLEAASAFLSSAAGHGHVADRRGRLAAQRRQLLGRLLILYPALLPCAVTPAPVPPKTLSPTNKTVHPPIFAPKLTPHSSFRASSSPSFATPFQPPSDAGPTNPPLNTNSTAPPKETNSSALITNPTVPPLKTHPAMPPLKTRSRPSSPPPPLARQLSSGDVLGAFIAGSNPVNLDRSSVRRGSGSPSAADRVGPLGPCLCLEQCATEALLCASPRSTGGGVTRVRPRWPVYSIHIRRQCAHPPGAFFSHCIPCRNSSRIVRHFG